MFVTDIEATNEHKKVFTTLFLKTCLAVNGENKGADVIQLKLFSEKQFHHFYILKTFRYKRGKIIPNNVSSG